MVEVGVDVLIHQLSIRAYIRSTETLSNNISRICAYQLSFLDNVSNRFRSKNESTSNIHAEENPINIYFKILKEV